MDLANCKLISRAKSKISEKTPEYKYWESSAIPLKSYSKYYNDPYSRNLCVSRSAPKLHENIKPKSSKKIISMVGMDSSISNIMSRKDINRAYIEQISQRKKISRYPFDISVNQVVTSMRNVLRPNKLIPIHKPTEEKPASQGTS